MGHAPGWEKIGLGGQGSTNPPEIVVEPENVHASTAGVTFHYAAWHGKEPQGFGDDTTYALGMPWLDATCPLIEDWGAGLGYARKFVKKSRYFAVDGEPTSAEFVDQVADLRYWRSRPDGIFMRHVLEHNAEWPLILANAVESFQRRMVLILFTPFADVTHNGVANPFLDINFSREELVKYFADYLDHEEDVLSNTQYLREHLFYLQKPFEVDRTARQHDMVLVQV